MANYFQSDSAYEQRIRAAHTSPVKILQISSAQSMGGGERHLADLANGLAGRGHEVYLAVRPNSPIVAELKNVGKECVTTLTLRNSLDAKSARELSKLVRKNQIQLVHAHMARDYPLAAYAVRQNREARLIVTRHVLFPLSRLHRITLSGGARMIAVSQAVASQLRSDRVVTPERISVVLNGIDTTRFEEASLTFDRDQFLQDWRLPSDSLLVGTVGELTPLKGQADFLHAASQVITQYPNVYFFIAGIDHSPENKNLKALEHLIEELNLTDHVRLVGWLEDLVNLYCALDVFVSASHTESFGLAIAEAMASSAAVVATETEGAREIIQPEETGILVPIGNVDRLGKAILELLNDRDKRLRFGQAAQQTVAAKFGIERMIDETESIYRKELESIPANEPDQRN
jgi:glycosyltransferase involved in cell wall biosynthesis